MLEQCGHGMYCNGFFSAGMNTSMMSVKCLSTNWINSHLSCTLLTSVPPAVIVNWTPCVHID